VELREYYAIFRKWWWLLALCAVLGAGAAYVVSVQMTPTYEASTLLMIGDTIDIVNPTTGEMQTSEKLAQPYAELIKTRPILDATVAALNLPDTPNVTVSLVRNTQLMRITVADSIPERAAATADELARQLIQQSPSDPQRQEQAYREFVRGQLSDLEQEIATLSQVIVAEKEKGDSETLAQLEQALNERRANYSALLSYVKGSSTNYISVIEAARIPDIPTKPKVMQNTLLAAIVGLMLAGGAAFLIEYLDDSVKSQADVELLGLPTLGVIAQVTTNGTGPETVTMAHPKSPFSEAYRMLRTNLRYSVAAGDKRRVYLVTSVGPAEGKTTTAANLAVVMAQGGQRTILVDADLRRPRIHKVFDCANEVGLTSLLVGEVESLDEALRSTEVDGLRVLPCGAVPPNPAELLGSARMAHLLDELSAHADIVILDSPPILAVTDAGILAGMVTGTILVAEAGETRLEAFAQGAELVKKTGGNLLGIVLNRLHSKHGGYYYYHYNYYSRYGYGYGENGDGAGNGKGDARHANNGRAAAAKSAARRMESAGPRDDIPQN